MSVLWVISDAFKCKNKVLWPQEAHKALDLQFVYVDVWLSAAELLESFNLEGRPQLKQASTHTHTHMHGHSVKRLQPSISVYFYSVWSIKINSDES